MNTAFELNELAKYVSTAPTFWTIDEETKYLIFLLLINWSNSVLHEG